MNRCLLFISASIEICSNLIDEFVDKTILDIAVTANNYGFYNDTFNNKVSEIYLYNSDFFSDESKPDINKKYDIIIIPSNQNNLSFLLNIIECLKTIKFKTVNIYYKNTEGISFNKKKILDIYDFYDSEEKKLRDNITKVEKILNRLGENVLLEDDIIFKTPDKINIGNKVSIKRGVIIDGRSSENIGIKIGNNCIINEYCYLDAHFGGIEILDNCYLGPHSLLYGHAKLSIGVNVMIAAYCKFLPPNHNYADLIKPMNSQGYSASEIIIEDDVWLGAGAIILGGVKLKKGCIIGAGSVVTKSTESFGIYCGQPAKLIKYRTDG